MKIEIEYNNCDLGGLNFEKKLSEKKTHLICTARLGGLSIFQEEVINFRANIIPNNKAITLLNTVNSNNKTGSLFPDLNITILPLSIYNLRNSFIASVVIFLFLKHKSRLFFIPKKSKNLIKTIL